MEREFKHTPGPWGLVYNDDGTLEEGMAGTNRVTGIKSESGFGEIAMVIYKKTNILGDSKKLQADTFLANAKLIAAAPQLLEACIKALDNLRNGEANTKYRYIDVVQSIEEAINKATS